MARQRITPGGSIDTMTADEFVRLLPRKPTVDRVRAPGNVVLNGAGAGDDEVYKVPIGMQFALRRVVVTLTGNVPTDPNSGNVLLNAVGKFVALTRSGSLIEYLQPTYGSAIQVPGVQTWGDQQGPYLQNGEVLGVVCGGLTASQSLTVYIEGLLYNLNDHRSGILPVDVG